MDRRGRDPPKRSAARQPQGQRASASAPAPQPPQHTATRGHAQPESRQGSSTHSAAQTPIKNCDVDLLMHFAQHSSDSPGKAAMPDKSLRLKPTSALVSSTQAKPTFLVPSASPLAKPSAEQRSQPPSKQKADMNNFLLRTCRHCHKSMSVPEMDKHEGTCQASTRRKPGRY